MEESEKTKEYLVAAKEHKGSISVNKSTIAEYKGRFFELFGGVLDGNFEQPPEFPMLVKIIKKQNGDKICSIIIDILKEE